MFSFMSKNWQGRPLDSRETIVNLISSATKKGLKIEAEIDSPQYEKGISVSDAEMARLNIEHASLMVSGFIKFCLKKH
jgi:hypothetical protein